MTPEELAGKLTPAAFQALLEPFMQRATLLALRESQPVTPVDTGTLRRSETTRVEAGGLDRADSREGLAEDVVALAAACGVADARAEHEETTDEGES